METVPIERQQHPSNIVLTGFMGTGKSVAGHILARETGREFVDSDELIVERAGKSIADIFFDDGEAVFRQYERRISRELANRRNLVISTGGRLMLDPLNALLLNRNALVFCLTASAEEILARTKSDLSQRPLLDVDNPAEKIGKLLKERYAGYSQYLQVDTGGRTIQAVAQEMLTVSNQLVAAESWYTQLTSRIPVRHPDGIYQVVIGKNILTTVSNGLASSSPVAIVTDTNVAKYHLNNLGDINTLATVITPPGEEHKNLETVRSIYAQLLLAGMDRTGTVITLGGGVVGDMGGFAAATFMRGVGLVQCPTSLLAMVDASVGGKTGVDFDQGKNLVGAFKQPEAVYADLDTLRTLPGPELLSGMAEIVKAAVIASPDLLSSIEELAPRIAMAALSGDQSLPLSDIQAFVVESVLIKREVIEADPFERNIRRHLNLGHTFAHAIEKASHFSIRHGEAVSIGLVAASRLSASMGLCKMELSERLEILLLRLSLPVRIPAELSSELLIQSMKSDKKVESGEARFVLMRDIGDVFLEINVPEPAVLAVLDKLRDTVS